MFHLTINADQGAQTISRHIYGHFAEHLGRCIYEGFWVGEDSEIPNTRGIRNDTVAALKKLNIPNLRWPGGCFADEYHWEDGIGPRENRPSSVNTHWGGVTENNHFGTHEFLDLCEMLGCEPYICGNVGSGTVRELQQWVEYVTQPGGSSMAARRAANGREAPWKVRFWGVGNENWGCGGDMRPEHYADLYRNYATYVRNFGDNVIYKIAGGANASDYRWTEVLMESAAKYMDGLSLHFYTIYTKPGATAESGADRIAATGFDESDWYGVLAKTLEMDELLTRHGAIMDRYDPQKRVGIIVDEWGNWFQVAEGTNPGFLYQQNTLLDALVAAINLNIFHAHAERVHMTNIAQVVNVLQSVILTDGAKIILTPTYHVFEMYKVHQDAQLLPLHHDFTPIQGAPDSLPHLHASASAKDGLTHVSLANLHPTQAAQVELQMRGGEYSQASARLLTADALDAHNTFEAPETLAPRDVEITAPNNGALTIDVPPKSVMVIALS